MTEFSEKKLLKNKEMVLENGVKNIEAAAYKGARTVLKSWVLLKKVTHGKNYSKNCFNYERALSDDF